MTLTSRSGYGAAMHVVELYVYPLKSAAAVPCESAQLTARGFADDRRWMLVDERGEFLSARTQPKLLRVRAEQQPGHLMCSAEGRAPLNVRTPEGEPIEVEIWEKRAPARDAGDEAARWFVDWLGVPCRLVYQDERDRREVEARPLTRASDQVSFADSYPVHVIGTASLTELNRRLPEGVVAETMRFRPNLLVQTEVPFEEDRWGELTVGECRFAQVKRCPRCVLTTRDPAGWEGRDDNEPLRTLAKFRREAGATWFGVNLVPRSLGVVRRGDTVRATIASAD